MRIPNHFAFRAGTNCSPRDGPERSNRRPRGGWRKRCGRCRRGHWEGVFVVCCCVVWKSGLWRRPRWVWRPGDWLDRAGGLECWGQSWAGCTFFCGVERREFGASPDQLRDQLPGAVWLSVALASRAMPELNSSWRRSGMGRLQKSVSFLRWMSTLSLGAQQRTGPRGHSGAK